MQYEKAFSGGTTGDPVKVLMDRNSRSHSTAAIMRYFNWWGCEIGQKTVVLWGRQFSSDIGKFGKIKTDIHRLLTKKLYLNTFMLNDNILLEHYKSFHAYNPYILRGYANSVYLFAQFIDIRIYHFWKQKTKGRMLWLRNNFSTFTSQFIDTFTVIFLLCSFGALPWDLFVGLLVSGFIFKVLVALIDTPLLYLGVYLFRKKFDLEINEEIDI